MNRLKKLANHGQSIWLDYISRSFVTGGELRRLIDEDGLTGVTSNPAIFEEAISSGDEYDESIRQAGARDQSAMDAYWDIAIKDVQLAADELRDVFDRTDGQDGYVSLEVSPHLANDAAGSSAQARELWGRLARPNVMIKIPGTEQGLLAIRRLIAEGINVNVTLLFGLTRYRSVVDAYMSGLEDRLRMRQPIRGVASVASFFLSRIDIAVDRMLEQAAEKNPDLKAMTERLRGRAAIASAKQAYQIYRELHGSERFQPLAAARARPQRLLWASTSTKNLDERDVRYVEALIGPETINTLPRKTLEAFRDHGDPSPRLTQELDAVRDVMRELGECGVSLEAVSHQLEDEGIRKFVKPFDLLQTELERKLGAAIAGRRN